MLRRTLRQFGVEYVEDHQRTHVAAIVYGLHKKASRKGEQNVFIFYYILFLKYIQDCISWDILFFKVNGGEG